jgi:hypothetical protein
LSFLLRRLWGMSDGELEAFAAAGSVPAAISLGTSDELVFRIATGRKPAATDIAYESALWAHRLGLIVRAYTQGEKLAYVVAVDVDALARLKAAWSLGFAGVDAERGEYEIELGLALGYSKADVAAFYLQRYRAREGAA